MEVQAALTEHAASDWGLQRMGSVLDEKTSAFYRQEASWYTYMLWCALSVTYLNKSPDQEKAWQDARDKDPFVFLRDKNLMPSVVSTIFCSYWLAGYDKKWAKLAGKIGGRPGRTFGLTVSADALLPYCSLPGEPAPFEATVIPYNPNIFYGPWHRIASASEARDWFKQKEAKDAAFLRELEDDLKKALDAPQPPERQDHQAPRNRPQAG